MALIKYISKRNFKITPEPKGGKPDPKSLRFVVQKHDASRLHYDFRLEVDGVLKSWAVPKGPSTDPKIKRLAMQVEDHPFDYRTFEGVIPAGYGAGTVMVWDEGTYTATDEASPLKVRQNKNLSDQWKAGKMKFTLEGKKLKGEFLLLRSTGLEENAWLLMKVKDEYASSSDITAKDKSVLSEMSLEQIKKTNQFQRLKSAPGSKPVGTDKIRPANRKSSSKKMDDKTLLVAPDETQVRILNGHELTFTHLNKLFWPEEVISKRDMLNYYLQVAPVIMPYLKGRPHSLHRHPDGIDGESFYQKDVTGKVPSWVKTFLYHSGSDQTDKHFMVAEDEASLLYMASLGCIEINPWSSRISHPDHPDWCIIDLDPDENSFDQVIEAAQVTKQVLDSMKVNSFPKTSGSTGIHIYIPLGAKYTYEQSKDFAHIVATLVQRQIPQYTSLERMVKARKGKMYIDFLQNRPQATVSAPYSLRPRPGATVSMPIHWDEVKKGLKMADFNIHNALERIQSEGDIFKPVLGRGINLVKLIEQNLSL